MWAPIADAKDFIISYSFNRIIFESFVKLTTYNHHQLQYIGFSIELLSLRNSNWIRIHIKLQAKKFNFSSFFLIPNSLYLLFHWCRIRTSANKYYICSSFIVKMIWSWSKTKQVHSTELNRCCEFIEENFQFGRRFVSCLCASCFRLVGIHT